MRPHAGDLGRQNRHQHAAFLAEVEHSPALHGELVDWFLTLPLWLELPELRVVHACWHPQYMAQLMPNLKSGLLLDEAMMIKASRSGTKEFRQIETLLKGIEVSLPPGCSFIDKSGITRHAARTRWWDSSATTYREAALLPANELAQLPNIAIPENVRIGYASNKPVFVGHYWMTGRPEILSPVAACVDYSAGKGGPLVAYRWSGEPALSSGNFVASE